MRIWDEVNDFTLEEIGWNSNLTDLLGDTPEEGAEEKATSAMSRKAHAKMKSIAEATKVEKSAKMVKGPVKILKIGN